MTQHFKESLILNNQQDQALIEEFKLQKEPMKGENTTENEYQRIYKDDQSNEELFQASIVTL